MNFNKKKWLRSSILIPALTDGILVFLLHIDHQLTPIGIAIVAFFWFFVFHIFIEWIEFIGEFKELKERKSHVETILGEFAEADMMLKNLKGSIKQDLNMLNDLMGSIKPDLGFDKSVKINKEHLDFHLFVSRIKYQDYLQRHFVYHSEKRVIRHIPKLYFEQSIWKKLVGDSKVYLSIQLLDNANTKFYIEDTARRDMEINFLKSKLSQRKNGLTDFHKLFILKDNWVDWSNKTITEENIKTYLSHWFEKFNTLTKTDGKAELKIIKLSDASGAIQSKAPEDIGIFDNILGIQSVVKDFEDDINRNSLGFDFSMDSSLVSDYKKDYDAIFKKAINLKDFFNGMHAASVNS